MSMPLDVIINEDCLEGMAKIPDGSVDLIVMDPPYFRVMTEDYLGNKYDWDDQWKDREDYLTWMGGGVFSECERILKDKGSLFCFADDMMSPYVHVEADKHFKPLNEIIWVKPNGRTNLGWATYRKFSPVTERIIFCEKKNSVGMPATGLEQIHCDPDCFKTIRGYLVEERDRLMADKGLDMTQFRRFFTELTGTARMEYHYFGDYQWLLPTEDLYHLMQTTGYWRREYEDLRRPFNQGKNYTDVWTYCITSTYEDCTHPTQKPLDMIERMVRTCTNPNDVVLDPFMGSGTTACACVRTGRHYIGFETDRGYYEGALKRIAETKPAISKTIFDY